MPLAGYSKLVPVLLLGACAPQWTAEQDPLLTTLDRQAPVWLARHDVPGLAVAYIRDGAVEWTRTYGEQAKGVPATDRTLYNVASLTKPLFAEVILRLAADGRLSLDEPLSSHWIDPDLAADRRHEILTPRLALSHRTGLPNWRSHTDGVLGFQSEPGATFGYSGEGYEYLLKFAENKLGEPFESLAREYVFAPLAMTSTAFTRQPWFRGRVAQPAGPEGSYGPPSYQTEPSAADDLYTTIGDYASFLASVMNRDRLPVRYAKQRDSLHVVDPGAVAACEEFVGRCPDRGGMGLGWSVLEYPDGPVLWHTGSDAGERAMVFYFPRRGEGAVLLTNGANGFEVISRVGILLFGETGFADYLQLGKS